MPLNASSPPRRGGSGLNLRRYPQRRSSCGLLTRIFSWTIAFAAAWSPAIAEPSSRWNLQAWHVEEGLPDNRIVGLVQLPDGYLCVATREGVVRFNGANFENITAANPSGVIGGGVRAMFADARGGLWLDMFRETLVHVSEHSTEVFTAREGVPNGDLTDVIGDAEGRVWLVIGGRTCTVQDQQIRTIELAPAVLARDVHDQAWCAVGRSIGILTARGFVPQVTVEAEPVVISRSQSGGLWVCAGQQLFRLTEATELVPQHTFSAGFRPTCLLEDRAGVLWVGSAKDGLLRFDGTSVEAIGTSRHSITCLLEDREGNIWLGSAGGGVSRVRRRTLRFSGPQSGDSPESLASVCEDRQGRLWTATSSGKLARRVQDEWMFEPWAGNNVSCVAADTGGDLWIGTHGHGLMQVHLPSGERRTWTTKDGLPGDSIRFLFVAGDQTVWIATQAPAALCKVSLGKVESIAVPKDVRTFRAIAQDASGAIWIGTSEGRIFRVEDKGLYAVPIVNDATQTSVRCLHATPDGGLWIGYAGRGVGWLKDGNFKVFSSSTGLIDDTVWHIASDQHNAIWITGPHGISRISLAEAKAVAEGKQALLRPALFGRGEGHAGFVGNYNNMPSAVRTGDGILFFATSQGLLELDPAACQQNLIPPPVMLERVVVDEKIAALRKHWSWAYPAQAREAVQDLKPDARLRLLPSHRRLAFDFAALSYAAPENVRYRYRLENFDNDWTETASERTARYSRLPAGEYTFRVIACNDSGIWNESGAAVTLIVEPFFWQTWWFRLAAMASFTVAVVLTVRWLSFRKLQAKLRLAEQQAALSEERARIAQDIHDDLGGSLSHIKFLSESAAHDQAANPQAAEPLQQITATVRQILKSLDEIVWAINPRNDTLPGLISYLGHYAVDFLRTSGMRFELELPDNPPELTVASDLRHHVFLVVKEALTNIARHSAAHKVRLEVKCTSGSLVVIIQDDGRGFDPAVSGAEGDGLQNMRQRMQKIGGEIAISSGPGGGTRISLEVKTERTNPVGP